MPFEIVRNNIVNMYADVIVNTANPQPVIGSGVDSAIHQAAGPALLEARRQIGDISVGEAGITPAFSLHAKYVIHTVGPVWQDGMSGEAEFLRNCYLNSLKLAVEHKCESIAFPLISTGNYGFPKDLALQTAISTISSFLLEHEIMVYLVVFDRKAYALSEKLFKAVASYIDDHYVEAVRAKEYSEGGRRRRIDAELTEYSMVESCSMAPVQNSVLMPDKISSRRQASKKLQIPKAAKAERKLEDLLQEVEDTFSESLLRWIIKKDKTNPEVYKKANMDRKLFSKILNNKDYKPSKLNAIALAIALELNLDETKDFIGRAGYALTHSSKLDIIVEWFILQGNYDVFEINMILFEFGQPTIGG